MFRHLLKYSALACLFFALSNLYSCQSHSSSTVNLSFYHWKSQFALSSTALNYLDTLAVEKIYLRCFDIDWDFNLQQAIPLAPLDIKSEVPNDLQVIPTLFITNRTFLHLPDENLPDLVDKTHQKLTNYLQQFPDHSIPEIQFDCDWSGQTRDKYFRFLEAIKVKFDTIPLSATIRLHQIKYFKQTGVPPVTRGMLMFYNMGKVEEWESRNSILDLDIARNYLYHFDDYPIALDLALPLFSWGVLFREGQMIRLINPIDTLALKDSTRFLKITKNRFEVVKNTYLEGHYLYQGDAIRVEQVELEQLTESLHLLKAHWPTADRNIVFYHLDSATIKDYPYEKLQQLRPLFAN